MVNVLAHLSDIVIPLLIFFVVGYGLVSRVKVYESFLKGAQEGIKIVIDIVPFLFSSSFLFVYSASGTFFQPSCCYFP